MPHRIFDFAGDDLVLAGGAVPHTATVIEVEVVALRKFEDVFFAAVPVEFDAGFLKNDFRHLDKQASRLPNARQLQRYRSAVLMLYAFLFVAVMLLRIAID